MILLYFRYNYSKTKFEMMRTQRALQEGALLEGTDRDPFIEQPLEVIDV